MVAAMKMHGSLFLAAALFVASPTFAAVGEWGEGTKAQARLIAAGVGADGKLIAGIEIALPEDWHTYWRSPGDAGVAPQFDFSGSTNLGAPVVDFPTPTRLDDGFAVTNVYENSVVLPVSATVTDPAKPVDVDVRLHIGVCADVCVPDDIEARLAIPVGEQDADIGSELTDVRNALPGPPQPGVFAFSDITRDGGTDNHPVFRFTGVLPDAKDAGVFVEGPADWSPYTPEFMGEANGTATWSVKFTRLGAKTPIAGASFRLTAVSGGHAIDQTLTLP